MTPTREQLELAAKALGLTVLGEYDESSGIVVLSPIEGQAYWNPVTDKSDSFDLMFTCGIRPYWTNSEFFDGSDYCAATTRHLESGIVLYKDHNNDKGLATMWAVFLCAVEIGKSLANGRAM